MDENLVLVSMGEGVKMVRKFDMFGAGLFLTLERLAKEPKRYITVSYIFRDSLNGRITTKVPS